MNEPTPSSLRTATPDKFSSSRPPPNTPAHPNAKPQQYPRPNMQANLKENVGTSKPFVTSEQDILVNESQQPSWPSSMFSFVGDIAGRAWQFARESAFSGFFAGGGDGYEFTDSTPRRVLSFDSAHLMPGHFPVDDMDNERGNPTHFADYQRRLRTKYERDSFRSATASDSDEEPRPSKRQQVSQGENWSVVNPYPQPFQRRRTSSALPLPSEHYARRRTVSPRTARPTTAASEASFSSRRSKPSAARLSSPRVASTSAAAHSSPLRSEIHRPASSASTRSPTSKSTSTPAGSSLRRKHPSSSSRPDEPVYPETHFPYPAHQEPYDSYAYESNDHEQHAAKRNTTTSLPTPRGEKRKANSTHPSPARNSMPTTSTSASNSPSAMAAAQDAQRYAAKRQREERRAEKSISRLEAQMQDMIRKGREALASRVEVEGEFDEVGDWDGDGEEEEREGYYYDEEDGGE